MSEHFFGLGKGHLSRRVAQAAEREGATLVNYDDPAEGKRHWFACPHRGEPFDSAVAKSAMAAVERAATKHDRVVLGLDSDDETDDA
jgi:hypothetical protein